VRNHGARACVNFVLFSHSIDIAKVKSLPAAAKLQLIIEYFHKSLTVHNLKELEKALPTVASIHGMQVKDTLQALSDENKLRVEKVGSINWYWSFLSDERKSKQATLEKLVEERDKLDAVATNLTATIQREEDEKQRQNEESSESMDRSEMETKYKELLLTSTELRAQLAKYSDNDPVEIQRKKDEILTMSASIETATDNIYSLEGYLLQMTNDRNTLESFRAENYGAEYVEGEGLREFTTGKPASVSFTTQVH
jgi:Mnd1 HTH domain